MSAMAAEPNGLARDAWITKQTGAKYLSRNLLSGIADVLVIA